MDWAKTTARRDKKHLSFVWDLFCLGFVVSCFMDLTVNYPVVRTWVHMHVHPVDCAMPTKSDLMKWGWGGVGWGGWGGGGVGVGGGGGGGGVGGGWGGGGGGGGVAIWKHFCNFLERFWHLLGRVKNKTLYRERASGMSMLSECILSFQCFHSFINSWSAPHAIPCHLLRNCPRLMLFL